MSRISRVFEQKESKVFVAYITAGDPDLETTREICQKIANSGADIIELGVPFSDPLADGPVNQMSAERALKSGTDLAGILRLVGEMREDGFETPLVIFSYFNPILAYGLEEFAKEANKVGIDGILILDLPPEESSTYRVIMKSQGIDTVFLASPTTSPIRLELINEASTGFVYYVSRTGVTGTQSEISSTLEDEMKALSDLVQKPLVVGFGISNAEQARKVASYGDGIVIGSAIVKLVAEISQNAGKLDKIGDFVSDISQTLKS